PHTFTKILHTYITLINTSTTTTNISEYPSDVFSGVAITGACGTQPCTQSDNCPTHRAAPFCAAVIAPSTFPSPWPIFTTCPTRTSNPAATYAAIAFIP